MSEVYLPLSETFYSIQGEGADVGFPMFFIRLAGCNLAAEHGGCTYCDTRYAQYKDQGVLTTLERIVEVARESRAGRICITGGEPLFQGEAFYQFLRLLADRVNVWITVETNGSYLVPIPSAKTDWRAPVHPSISWVVDVKCPGSGMDEFVCWENLSLLRYCDQLKFVLRDRFDYEYAKTVLKENPCAAAVSFQPAFSELEPRVLAEWILNDKLPVRLSLQIHKILWEPGRRGV